MKNLLLFIFLVATLFSCKKSTENLSEQNEKITTIKFEKTVMVSNSLLQGPGPKYKWAFGDDIDPGANYACFPSSNICFIIGPVYYRGQTLGDDEVYVAFENYNGRLRVKFDVESMTSNTRNRYFSNGYLEIASTKQFPDDLSNDLGLQIPYIIKKGNYNFVSQDANEITIDL